MLFHTCQFEKKAAILGFEEAFDKVDAILIYGKNNFGVINYVAFHRYF